LADLVNITLELGFEPFNGIIAGNFVLNTNSRALVFSASNTKTWTTKNNVDIHAVNADRRIVF